ncbi:MAG: LLM class flavin-dependent oxidoreductase [Candidatus Rokubacteria bacterium]|nr:LLM class flavin-dependent oxidoreductase [Candidatus Rokubacteria bacterium]
MTTRVAAYINPGRDLGAAVRLARRAEELGYESVWVTHGAGRDSFVVLAAYGAATSRVGLGNGVVPIYPRHPAAMAQAALTLAETTGGRFRLGIGVSHKPAMEGMLGLSLARPLEAMREYVAAVRAVFGGQAFEGRIYTARWPYAVPDAPPGPPIYLAALSPKMCELAGEIADGAVLWLTPPSYVADVAVPALERGRERAGKSLTGFEIVCPAPLAMTDDVPAAREAFAGELTRYLMLPFYRAMMEGAGLGEAIREFDRTKKTPAVLVDAIGAVGTAAAGRDYIERYRRAGVTLPAVRPITFPDASWYARTLEEVIA